MPGPVEPSEICPSHHVHCDPICCYLSSSLEPALYKSSRADVALESPTPNRHYDQQTVIHPRYPLLVSHWSR